METLTKVPYFSTSTWVFYLQVFYFIFLIEYTKTVHTWLPISRPFKGIHVNKWNFWQVTLNNECSALLMIAWCIVGDDNFSVIWLLFSYLSVALSCIFPQNDCHLASVALLNECQSCVITASSCQIMQVKPTQQEHHIMVTSGNKWCHRDKSAREADNIFCA